MAYVCSQPYPSGHFIYKLPPYDVQLLYGDDGIPYDEPLILQIQPEIPPGVLCGTSGNSVVFPCVSGPVSQVYVTVVTNQDVVFPNIPLNEYYSDINQTIYVSDDISYDLPTQYYIGTSAVGSSTTPIVLFGAGTCSTSRIESVKNACTVYTVRNPKHFDFRLIGNICAAQPNKMNLFYNRFGFKLAGGESLDLSDVVYLGAITFSCTSSGTRSVGAGRNFKSTLPFESQYCSPILSMSGIYVV